MGDFIDRNGIGLTNFEIFMCNGDYKAALKMLLDKIEKAPSADVAPVKHGRWIDEKHLWQGQMSAQCNQCKRETSYYTQPNYCPNCGAKMDGGVQK